MVETEFFVMPEQEEELRNFVNGIEVRFNTGYAGNAREAIALALKSNWTTSGWRRRHIVLVFSNEPALPLGKRSKCPNYPVGMPKDICELMAWWEGTWPTFEGTYQPRVGYMAAFTPPVEPWVDLQVLNRYYCLGNADVDYASLIDVALLVFGDF